MAESRALGNPSQALAVKSNYMTLYATDKDYKWIHSTANTFFYGKKIKINGS